MQPAEFCSNERKQEPSKKEKSVAEKSDDVHGLRVFEDLKAPKPNAMHSPSQHSTFQLVNHVEKPESRSPDDAVKEEPHNATNHLPLTADEREKAESFIKPCNRFRCRTGPKGHLGIEEIQ